MNVAKKQQSKELTFEEALERLEQLSNELESGELKLEDAIKKYEEGVKLYARCQEVLAKAEKRVQMLVRDAAGSLKAVPFEPESSEPTGPDDAAPEREEEGTSGESGPGRGSRKKADLF